MIFQSKDNKEVWGSLHPSSMVCPMAKEDDSCDCKYHLIDRDQAEIKSFDKFIDVNNKFTDEIKSKSITTSNFKEKIKQTEKYDFEVAKKKTDKKSVVAQTIVEKIIDPIVEAVGKIFK